MKKHRVCTEVMSEERRHGPIAFVVAMAESAVLTTAASAPHAALTEDLDPPCAHYPKNWNRR